MKKWWLLPMMNQMITTAIASKPQFIVTNLLARRLALMTQRSTRFVLLEGPARSSKTALAIQAVHSALLRGADITTGLIASRDMDTLNQNILEADVIGFMTTHPECSLQRDEIGGYYIHVPTFQGDKKILITGYDNESRWKKVLGGSIDIVFLDEANIANKTFIRETFARQLASNSPLTIFTTNGDSPENMIYQEFGNYAKPIGMIPASTLAIMNEFKVLHANDKGCINGTKAGYYYFFFRMEDNPTMTSEKLFNAKTIYPRGSYYYLTKILGERAVQGSMIFVDYMKDSLIVDKIPFYPTRFTLGFDIGATKAYSVIVLTAWNNDYSKACFIKVDSFKTQGYEAKKMHLKQFLITIPERERMMIETISIDSAESNFIMDIQAIIRKDFALNVIPSYKATIKDRIDMIIIGYSSGRLTMLKDYCRSIYDSYRASRWKEDAIGEIREDLGLELNDIMDASEYSLTTHMKQFSRGG